MFISPNYPEFIAYDTKHTMAQFSIKLFILMNATAGDADSWYSASATDD